MVKNYHAITAYVITVSLSLSLSLSHSLGAFWIIGFLPCAVHCNIPSQTPSFTRAPWYYTLGTRPRIYVYTHISRNFPRRQTDVYTTRLPSFLFLPLCVCFIFIRSFFARFHTPSRFASPSAAALRNGCDYYYYYYYYYYNHRHRVITICIRTRSSRAPHFSQTPRRSNNRTR
jgi:hypothetical protein